MRSDTDLGGDGSSRSPGRWLAFATAVAALLVFAPAALAIKPAEKEDFLVFKHCPLTQAVVCVVSDTTGGEFVLGTNKKSTPITKPVLIQGGLAGTPDLAPEPLIEAVGAESFQKVAEEIPGGLTGISGVGGDNEITATAELAGPVSSVVLNAWALLNKNNSTAVTLPIKVHLKNEELGEDCYIGSDAEPIVLHLTTGTTKPPEGTEPLKGGWEKIEYPVKGDDIVRIKNVKLVDNTFAVPGASGCGPEGLTSVVDEAIDEDIGLPAEAGKSSATMIATSEQTNVEYAKKYLPKEKKEKTKK